MSMFHDVHKIKDHDRPLNFMFQNFDTCLSCKFQQRLEPSLTSQTMRIGSCAYCMLPTCRGGCGCCRCTASREVEAWWKIRCELVHQRIKGMLGIWVVDSTNIIMVLI